MAKKPIPTPEELRQLLRYEPETGKLFWLPRRLDQCVNERYQRQWNAAFAGKEAFTSADQNGYRQGTIHQQRHYAHRIIWMMVMGEVPIQVDHINGDTQDNRISNLRNVSRSTNQKNTKLMSTNTSGHAGVYWDKVNRGWTAMIYADRKQKNLGRFKTFDDAVTARQIAEAKYGYHPNHGRR